MRITVKEASELLGYPPQAVRTLIRHGKLPIGECIGDRRKTYYISSERLRAYMEGGKQ